VVCCTVITSHGAYLELQRSFIQNLVRPLKWLRDSLIRKVPGPYFWLAVMQKSA
jgi:hypothetical protein